MLARYLVREPRALASRRLKEILCDPPKWLRIVLGLAIGMAGGWLFAHWDMPLPWMLGPMCFCTVAALLRLPIAGPAPIRSYMTALLAVMLGANFTPHLLGSAADWAASLVCLFAFVAVTAVVGIPYFRRVAGYDPITAYFSAMPGGFGAMLLIALEMGADERRVVLAHSARVLIIVFCLPFLMRWIFDVETGDRAALWALTEVPIHLPDVLVMLACAAVGWPLARKLKLPAPALLGPMLLSAAAHLSGLTAVQVPLLLVNFAQWVIGVIVGCRFVGMDRMAVVRALYHGAGLSVIMLLIMALFAFGLAAVTDMKLEALILAYSPGGVAEMSIIALAMGIDVAFVTTHHVIRIAMIAAGAPIVFKLLKWDKIARPTASGNGH